MKQVERQCRNFMRLRALPGVGLAVLALLVLLLAGKIRAQEAVSANILGTVTDQSGAVIPDAQITVKNVGTGITNSAKTDAKGEYLVQFLQIGSYVVTVDAKGFKKYVAKDINLTAGDHARVDAKMALGGANETVTVSAVAAPALQTDTSTVGTEIPSTNIQDVPLSGRNLTDLVLMTAGVQTSVTDSALNSGCATSQQNEGYPVHPDDCRIGSGYAVDGQSDLNQNNQIDGMDNNDRRIGAVEVKPSIDAIEEVKVQTNLYSAESGRTSGGVVQIVTKSGSNTFKGSLYDYLRNDAFDAMTTWAQIKPMLHQNQFGATYGGPILKNKTFFFADYEGLIIHQSTSQGVGTSIPDQPLLTAIKGGSISDINTALAADGLGTIASLDPVAATLMQMFPSNSCPIGSASTCYYKGNTPRRQTANTGDIRIDQHINDRNTLYGRYSYNKTDTYNGGSLPTATVNGYAFSGASYAQQPEDNISLDYTHIFRPNLILDLKAGYTYSKNFNVPDAPLQAASILGFDCGAGVTCPQNTASNIVASGLPTIGGIGPSGGGGPGGPPGGGGGASGPGPSGNYTDCYDPLTLYQNSISPHPNPNIANPGWCSTAWSGLASGGPPGGGGGGGGGGSWSIAESSAFGIPLLVRDDTHQYSASLTWTKGTQNLKGGITLVDRLMEGAQPQNVYGSINFSNDATCSGINGGAQIANATAAFLMGCSSSKSRSFVAVNQHLRTYEPSAYVQDDWRILPKLTLNLGIRYDLYTPYTDENGYLSNFDPSVGLLVSPDLLGAQHSDKYANVPVDYHDIQPRFGFAYSLPQNMVVRGGFGMTYYPNTLGPNSTTVNAPFNYSLSCINPTVQGTQGTAYGAANSVCTDVDPTLDGGLPVPNLGQSAIMITATDSREYTSENINSTSTSLKTSYMYQYSLQLQKDWRSNIITVGYVGNLGRHIADYEGPNAAVDSLLNNPANNFGVLYTSLNQCTAPPGPGQPTGSPTPCSSYATSPVNGVTSPGIQEIDSRSNSDYNAMQATFLRRAAMGLTTSINYTWAHQLSDGYLMNEGGGQNAVCTRYGCRVDDGKGTAAASLTPVGPQQFDKGNSMLDMRHRLTGVLTYQLPFARNSHGILHGVAAGWTGNLMGTLQTGLHASLASGMGGGEVRPSVVPGCNPNKKPAGVTNRIDEWFDASCFQLQPYQTMGDAHKGLLVEPGMERADVSLIKQFDLHENYKLQLRMEGFNVTNHPSYGFSMSTDQMACDNFDPSAGNNCSYENEAALYSQGSVLLQGNPSMCETARTTVATGGGPGGGGNGYPGCIQNTQGLNRQFQFALKLTF